MAKKKKEEPIVDNETGSIKIKEKKEQQPTGNETKGNVTKVKAKMKKESIIEEETITKVDLNKPPETETETVDTDKQTETNKEVAEENQEEGVVVEEITEEGEDQEVTLEATQEEVEEAIAESEATGEPLPENIQKLMDFMEETGGDLNDYVKLNQDYSKLDDDSLLREYYRQTKKHLNEEEINFLMEDQFSYDEEEDDDREIRRKKLALKEQVASAKSHLDGQKSKYYEDIKAGSKLTQDQQKAVDFFNRYNKEAEENEKASEHMQSTFIQKTDNVFNDKFKGFEYNVGDKKFRFNVKNAKEVRDTQVDINNFVGKFLDKNHTMKDAKGYHKSIFTAMNADAIANHFYEQGKADAMKSSVAKAKNVDMNPRQAHGQIEAGGVKVKVLGDDSSDFKFKIKHNK